MTVTLTYDSTLARVRVTATGLAAADVASVERSTDGVRWTTVRGASAVPVSAGALGRTVDDYEFSSDVLTTYRVRGIETGAITFVAAGTAASGSNTSVTPGLPAGILAGDLLVAVASIRNSGTGTVNTPTGWTMVKDSGNLRMMVRRYVAGDVAPTITFAGGVANADTFGRIAAFRRASEVPAASTAQLNGSAQNIAYGALTPTAAGYAIVAAAWKQDDWTSVAALAGWTEISEQTSTTGDDASQAWDYQIQTTATAIPSGSFVVTGGAAAISRSMVVAFPHADYLNSQTNTITPALDGIWLKSIARPFLNRRVTVTDWTAPTRPARGGVFEVVGRSAPTAVNDVRGSKRFTLTVMTTDAADEENLDLCLSPNDIMLVHTSAACPVPGGYVTIGDTTDARNTRTSARRFWDLPCTIANPPGPDVVGATSTWQTVLSTYATWADVLAAHATWADLMTLVGSPSDVVVD
jgi:hypothetical protein